MLCLKWNVYLVHRFLFRFSQCWQSLLTGELLRNYFIHLILGNAFFYRICNWLFPFVQIFTFFEFFQCKKKIPINQAESDHHTSSSKDNKVILNICFFFKQIYNHLRGFSDWLSSWFYWWSGSSQRRWDSFLHLFINPI